MLAYVMSLNLIGILYQNHTQVQTVTHKMNQSTGGDAMTVKSLVVIDGEKIEIKDLKDKEAFADRVNRQVLQSRNYEETGYTYEKNEQ